jgi:hypothetical protein
MPQPDSPVTREPIGMGCQYASREQEDGVIRSQITWTHAERVAHEAQRQPADRLPVDAPRLVERLRFLGVARLRAIQVRVGDAGSSRGNLGNFTDYVKRAILPG